MLLLQLLCELVKSILRSCLYTPILPQVNLLYDFIARSFDLRCYRIKVINGRVIIWPCLKFVVLINELDVIIVIWQTTQSFNYKFDGAVTQINQKRDRNYRNNEFCDKVSNVRAIWVRILQPTKVILVNKCDLALNF